MYDSDDNVKICILNAMKRDFSIRHYLHCHFFTFKTGSCCTVSCEIVHSIAG